MCDSLPKEFEKTTEVLPFPKYGLSTLEEFRKAEKDVQHLEWLKKAGLTDDETKLYLDNEAGKLNEGNKIEAQVLAKKLKIVYEKVATLQSEKSVMSEDVKPSTSKEVKLNQSQKQTPHHPDKGHPINRIKQLEETVFGYLRKNSTLIKRRRKERKLQRRKRLAQLGIKHKSPMTNQTTVNKPGSLWDLKEPPPEAPREPCDNIIGPKEPTMYTIKNNSIVKLPANQEQSQREQEPEADVVLPDIELVEPLLEGTKMSLDDIKKMERYKDYEPGIPSKVVHLWNIASTVTLEQLRLLFQQYVCDNGGPPDIQLLSGNLRGQAYVSFENYDVAISAVHEINGTIVNGYPIVAKFAPSTED